MGLIISASDTTSTTNDNSINARIKSKTSAGGDYNYSSANPYQLETISEPSHTLLNKPSQDITYTSFNKVKTIEEGSSIFYFWYGPDKERVKMEVYHNDNLVYTKLYFGLHERVIFADPNVDDENIYYISTSNENIGMLKDNQMYYFLHDHQGFIMTIANAAGDAVEFLSYDAWGRRRNPQDWTYNNISAPKYTNRGYTGHEHINEVGLINMNGRVYDPLLGLFISPDPFVQEPHNPSNYNRYSYVLNNPLKYTDPSGYKKTNRRCLTPMNTWIDVTYPGVGGGGIPAHFAPNSPSDHYGRLGGPNNNLDYNILWAAYGDSELGISPDSPHSGTSALLNMLHLDYYKDQRRDAAYISTDYNFSYSTNNSYSGSALTLQKFNGQWTFMIGEVNSSVVDPKWQITIKVNANNAANGGGI